MTNKQFILSGLESLLTKEKFSILEWTKYSIRPPSSKFCDETECLTNSCIQNVLNLVLIDSNKNKLKKELLKGLRSVRRSDYLQEQRELISTCFERISSLVDISIKFHLVAFVYGWHIVFIMRLYCFITFERLIGTLSQECSQCKSKLETRIYKKNDSESHKFFLVVKCKICGQFNILEIGSGIKEQVEVNYEIIDRLSMKDYTLDQANLRLEQIFYFRQ